jgi:hypothetical protein
MSLILELFAPLSCLVQFFTKTGDLTFEHTESTTSGQVGVYRFVFESLQLLQQLGVLICELQ